MQFNMCTRRCKEVKTLCNSSAFLHFSSGVSATSSSCFRPSLLVYISASCNPSVVQMRQMQNKHRHRPRRLVFAGCLPSVFANRPNRNRRSKSPAGARPTCLQMNESTTQICPKINSKSQFSQIEISIFAGVSSTYLQLYFYLRWAG